MKYDIISTECPIATGMSYGGPPFAMTINLDYPGFLISIMKFVLLEPTVKNRKIWIVLKFKLKTYQRHKIQCFFPLAVSI